MPFLESSGTPRGSKGEPLAEGHALQLLGAATAVLVGGGAEHVAIWAMATGGGRQSRGLSTGNLV